MPALMAPARPLHPSSISLALRRLVLLPVLALALLAAASVLGPVGRADAASSDKVARAATVARQQVGDPYRYGAAGPNAFDCSGLMAYSFKKAGVTIPRTSSQQAREAKRISKSKLRRGDLMFFHKGGRVYHAAMFLRRDHGKIVMLHAPGSGKKVRLDSPWTTSWYAGTMRG